MQALSIDIYRKYLTRCNYAGIHIDCPTRQTGRFNEIDRDQQFRIIFYSKKLCEFLCEMLDDLSVYLNGLMQFSV